MNSEFERDMAKSQPAVSMIIISLLLSLKRSFVTTSDNDFLFEMLKNDDPFTA